MPTATTVPTATPTPVGPPPIAAITGPTEGTEIAGRTNIVGTASSTTLLRWTLDYRAHSGTAWTTALSGTTSIANGTLGALDPTMLLNGMYELRLTATDVSGRSTQAFTNIVVKGDQKVGLFTTSFVDLEIPVAGMPIQVVRTYDSRNKQSGDFGYGWSLDLKSTRVEENLVAGSYWNGTRQGSFLPTYCLVQARPHVVSITLPDGTVYRFEPTTSPQCQQVYPIQEATIGFRALAGTRATLTPIGDNTAYVMGSWPGASQLVGYDTLEPVDFDAYLLTLPDGRRFTVSQSNGLQEVIDSNGNRLTITRDGITHSAGKSVTFTRDSAGRITRITDPMNRTVGYSYDAAGDLLSVTDQVDATTTMTYNRSHGLLSVRDPRGIQPLRNEYGDDGRLLRHIDAAGNIITYTHRLETREELITDRTGRQTVLLYDTAGNVVQTTDPLGRVTRATWDDRRNKLSETDPQGRTWTWTFDANDNRLTETDPLGQTTRWTYNAQNQVLTTTDARNNVTTNTYDGNNNLLTYTDALNNVTTYTYDAQGNRTSERDPLGNTTRYAYDGAGNLVRQTDPLGFAKVFTYDANNNQLTETVTRTVGLNVETLVTRYTYDGLNRRIGMTYPDGTTTATAYNAIGRRDNVTDRLGRVTRYEYDSTGRLARTTFPDGTTETATYDAEGRRQSLTDRQGRTTAFAYDETGRLIRTTYADGSYVATAFDAAGRVIAERNERGNITRYGYDAAGRRTVVTDTLGLATTSTFDALGYQRTSVDANGNTTRYEVDALGRCTREVYADGTDRTFTYDALDRKTSETDPEDRTTRWTYDARGLLVAVTDALDGTTRYAYDELGNRIAQTDANGITTRFEYDRVARQTRTVSPDGRAETLVYDSNGNVLSRLDRNGRTTTYTYDTNDLLLTRVYEDGTEESFTYTAVGRRASATDARGTMRWTYDARDRVTGVVDPETGSLVFAYDAQGNRERMDATVGGSTLRTDYTYDAASRLRTVSDPWQRAYGVSYDAVGNRVALDYPNGIATTLAYDDLNRLTGLETARADQSVVQSFAYTLGAAGQRERVEDQDGNAEVYTYDALYRLTGEQQTGVAPRSASYGYDAVGNRTSAASAGTTTAYTYDNRDRMLTAGAGTYTYDFNGNQRTTPDGATYRWDDENRLVEVVLADRTRIEYTYDVDGNRVRTRTTPPNGPPTVTNYLVDGTGMLAHVVAETNAQNALTAFHVRAGDHVLATVRGGGPSFFHADGLGSVRTITNAAGAVTDRYRFTAWGEMLAHTGTDANAYLFAGEQRDPNTGFYYNRARWLMPDVGRFASADTWAGVIEDPLTLHRYMYAHDDPTNLTDPTGRFGFSVAGLSVSINIQGNLRTTQTAASQAVLARVRAQLIRLNIQSYKQLAKNRIANHQIHHLIEKRLWNQNPVMRQIFSHMDDIPSVNLTPAQHQVYTNAWRAAFPYRNQAGHILKPTLEDIIGAAQRIYANDPQYLKAILLALL